MKKSKWIFLVFIAIFFASCAQNPIAEKIIDFGSDPVWSPDGEKIAFNSDRDGDFEIYVMDSDGTDLVKITDNNDNDASPSWSPDGKRMAFTSYSNDSSSISIMNSDGSMKQSIYQGGWGPSWSPDGDKIAFAKMSTNKGNVISLIYTMNADGSDVKHFFGDEEGKGLGGTDPAWSPDGTKIAFLEVGYSTLYSTIIIINVNSNKEKDLLAPYNLPEHMQNQDQWISFSWSPNGEKIIFSFSPNKNDGTEKTARNLYVINTDGSRLKQITNDLEPESNPRWSPDGKKVAYSVGDEGIYIIKLKQ
jgi:Tol biopolymer transport system component